MEKNAYIVLMLNHCPEFGACVVAFPVTPRVLFVCVYVYMCLFVCMFVHVCVCLGLDAYSNEGRATQGEGQEWCVVVVLLLLLLSMLMIMALLLTLQGSVTLTV